MDGAHLRLLRPQPATSSLIPSPIKHLSQHHPTLANPQWSKRLPLSPGVAAFPRSPSSPAVARLPRSLSLPVVSPLPASDAMSSAACGFFSGVSGSPRQLTPASAAGASRSERIRATVSAFGGSSSSGTPKTGSTRTRTNAARLNRKHDPELSTGQHPPVLDSYPAATPSSNPIESTALTSSVAFPPVTEAVAKLSSPRMDRRTLLGLGLATLAATGAAELGLVDAAFAKTQEPPKKQPMWFLGDAGGSGVDGDGLLLGGPGASKSRVYDATVVGEPAVIGDKGKAWEKLLAAKVVYLGEAEVVRDLTDKVVALEILRKLRDESFAAGRPVTLALSAFPRSMQPLLDKFIGGRLPEDELQVAVNYWPKGRFQEMLPLLRYCREAGVRLFACGVPPKVLRTVQAGGVQALSPADRKRYAPPLGGGSASALRLENTSGAVSSSSGFSAVPSYGAGVATSSAGAGISSISGGNGRLLGIEPIANAAEPLVSRTPSARASFPFGPGPYWFAQARVVEDHAIAGAISQAMTEGGKLGLLVVLTGASHVRYGVNGRGVPSRVSDWLKARQENQAVVLMNPERQRARMDADFPEADFFWYSGSWACTRNCYDRAEIARVMGAAGRTPDALPRDLQMGIERGLISPDTLQSFFELENNPLVAEATKRIQGLRERFYADPRFLQRLCTEEAISVATSLAAQFQKRGDRFWSELEYVATDVLRGTVVNAFSVWLPAPRLSFREAANPAALAAAEAAGGFARGPAEKIWAGVTAWMGTLPDNAFQRAGPGREFGLAERIGTVLVAGTKLFGVGFISSVGTLSLTNFLVEMKNKLPAGSTDSQGSGQTGIVSASQTADGAGKTAAEVAGVTGGSVEAAPAAAAGAASGAIGSAAAAITPPVTTARSPVFKTALVYGAFLSTSANLRYQGIAGIVEHWIADYYLASNPVAGTVLSFLARTANSYWGTSQWVDLARLTGLQQTPKSAADADAAAAAAPAALPAAGTAAAAAAFGEEVSGPVSVPSLIPAYAGAYATASDKSVAALNGAALTGDAAAPVAQAAAEQQCIEAAATAIAPYAKDSTVDSSTSSTSAVTELAAALVAPAAASAAAAAADSSAVVAASAAAEAAGAAEIMQEFGAEAVAAAQAGARLVPVEVLSERDVLNLHQQQQF